MYWVAVTSVNSAVDGLFKAGQHLGRSRLQAGSSYGPGQRSSYGPHRLGIGLGCGLLLLLQGLPSEASPAGSRGQLPRLFAATAPFEQGYRLGAGDRIFINIFNVPEFSGEQSVLADGSVNLPILGRIQLSGLSLDAAGKQIANAYRVEIINPEVTVILLQPRALRVAIAGEVGQPGLYTLTPSDGVNFPSVAQAIQAAGGVTQAADLSRIQLRRGGAFDQGGEAQTTTLNLWRLLEQGDITQDMALRDGDAILVSEAPVADIETANRLSYSNLSMPAGQPIVVGVVGEVFRPGAYELGSGGGQGRTTVTKALQTAGGIKPTANIRNVQVRRVARSGAEQLIDLDFWQLLQSGDLKQDLLLQQGDTVIVPIATEPTPNEMAQITAANLSPDAIQVNVIGEVTNPGVVQVVANTTLNQAVLAAGGFTKTASESVELIRLNPNGTLLTQTLEIDLRQGIDPQRNPVVLSNDIVIVGRSRGARLSDQIDGVLGPILKLLSPLRLLF